MRKLLILILLLTFILLLPPQAGRAQDEVQLGTLEINLWPEYDRSDMLVIIKIQLPPDTVVPTEFSFRIPSAAGKPFKVAFREEDGNLYEINDYAFQPGGEWNLVTFQTTSANFQLEYYDPRLVKQPGTNQRTYDYTWPGDYTVNSAVLVIQCPRDASQMQFTPQDSLAILVQCPSDTSQAQTPPEGVSSFIGGDNLLYYAYQIGTLAKSQTYNFSLSYRKTSDTLTAEKVQPESALPQSMWIQRLPWALGVLAVVLIAGGVWFFWRAGLPQAGEKKRRRRKPAIAARSEASADESGVYCHRCGRRATSGDVFCRSCGTKLQI